MHENRNCRADVCPHFDDPLIERWIDNAESVEALPQHEILTNRNLNGQRIPKHTTQSLDQTK